MIWGAPLSNRAQGTIQRTIPWGWLCMSGGVEPTDGVMDRVWVGEGVIKGCLEERDGGGQGNCVLSTLSCQCLGLPS